MKLHAKLLKDRIHPGVLLLEDDLGVPVLTMPCYGKADSTTAAAHGNLTRDPTFPFGDHPTGTYVVAERRAMYKDFGPWFFLLEPKFGLALAAKIHGREGMAIHGGPLNDLGQLRPTFGCLRVHDSDLEELGWTVNVGMTYVCDEVDTL